MKIAGGLTIILVLGALETFEALSTPFGKEDVGVGVAYDEKKGLTFKQKGGSKTDSEYNKSHQEDKREETSNTRELSLGGEDGGLNYEQSKETSETSQQIDEENSRKSLKQEESGDGYYHNRESENEENSKKVNKQSYRKKESKGFRLGNGGFKKKKTEFSESLKTSESEQQSSSNKEVEEEIIQDGDGSSHIKRISEDNKAVKESSNSESNQRFRLDEEANEDNTEGTGKVDNLSDTKVNGLRKLRRKRHTIYTPENENYSHALKDHHTNNGFEPGHQIRSNVNKPNGVSDQRDQIKGESHNYLGLQHGKENGDHHINYGFEQGHLLQNNEQHRLSGNEFYGTQKNINRENDQHLGIQHRNENGDQHINYGSEQGQLLHINGNHRSFGNEHYGVQDNSNRKNHQPLKLLHGHENGEFRNIHQGDEVDHYSGNEHNVNHGSYGFEEGLRFSPSSNNRLHGSGQGSNNLKLGNFNHHSISSESGKIRHENQRSVATHYLQNPATNLRHSENANKYNGNRNNGLMGTFHTVNHNGNYEHRNGNYRSSNGRIKYQYPLSSGSNRSNRQGQILKPYRSSENGNLLSRGRSYRLGNKNYESVNLNRNSRIINNARNYLYSRRNYGSSNSDFSNRFNGNNAHTGISHLAREGNSEQRYQPAHYRQGVKHEEVRRFLRNNGRHIFNDHQRFNSDNHIKYFEPFHTGYRPINNGDTRRHGAYNKRIIKHGAIDLHHFADNTHYSTGNGRYVFIPGNKVNNHRYYDTQTGLHFNIRKIPLQGGKNVIVPGNLAVQPGSNEQSGVQHGNSGLGLDLGFDIFYIGGGKYRYKDQIILAANIKIYLKELGIAGIPLTIDGLPLGLSGGYFPLDLGFSLTYQGDGTYKYQDNIIPHDQIIEFCKTKHITNISFTTDGFPENLFDGSLDSIFKNHLKLPIDLGNELEFIGNGHYKWKDQIIPAIEIGEFIKEHKIDIEITKEGLPLILLNGTLGINIGSTVHGNDESKEDNLLNPHGLFPYDVGSGVLYDGKGNYIYKNITIPRSNIIEFCKSHDLTNISLTDDGFPSILFNDIEHGHIGPNWKNPVYLGDDLYYIDNGHYKYKNQIILASDIGEFIKTNKINVHVTKDGLPVGIYFGTLDNIYSPDEEDDVTHKSGPINSHEGYPLDLGSKLIYLGNSSYIYDDKEIISSKDIIEFSKSHSITNITFTNDGFPADLLTNIKDGGSQSHEKFPIDLGDDLLYYESGHYTHKNKTIPIEEILVYIKENKLNVSVTGYGLPSQLVAENFDSNFAPDNNEVADAHLISILDIYGDFPYYLEFDIYYLGNGSYRCDNEIIDASDIINYCKSHNINDIVFTEDGYPVSLFNKTISDEGSDRKLPVDLGKGLRFLGHGHYEYENKIYPACHIKDIVKNLNLSISLTVDGIPQKILDANVISSSESTPRDPGEHNDEKIEPSHEKEDRQCPKGPIDLGEDIVYVGDCHYMYLDHIIPAKYILGLLDILHIHDIQLPVGPDDDFVDKGETTDTETDSKDNHILDLGFDILSLGNGTYKYKNRCIPGERYADFLKILGLKIELSGESEKLVEDSPKSDRTEEETLSLIDELLKNNDSKTEDQSTSTNDDNKSEDTKDQNDSSPGQQATDSRQPGKDDDNGPSLSETDHSTKTSTTSNSSNEHDLLSDDSTDNISGSNSNITSSVTSVDYTSEDFSSSTNSSDSYSHSSNSTITSDHSSDSTTNSSCSNDTTTSYESKTIETSSSNSSTTENKDYSRTNTDDSSKSDKTSSSSENSTVASDSFAANSASLETSDSTLVKDGDSFNFDHSSSSSENSTIVSESSSRNTSSTEYSASSSDSSKLSSNDSDNSSNSSSSDCCETEHNDSSGTNADDSLNSDNTSSSRSENSSLTSENSFSNSSTAEYSESSSSKDSSSSSNDSNKTSEDCADNASTTENSNIATISSQDSSSSDEISSSSNNSSTPSSSSSDNSSVTNDQNSPTTSLPGGL